MKRSTENIVVLAASISLSFIAILLVSESAYADGEITDGTLRALSEICDAARSSTDGQFACTERKGFTVKSNAGVAAFAPALSASSAKVSETILANTCRPYRATDGARVALWSLFKPGALDYAKTGAYAQISPAGLTDASRETLLDGVVSGKVKLSIQAVSGDIVAFSTSPGADEKYVANLLNIVQSAYSEGSNSGVALGIVADSDWMRSYGDVLGVRADETVRVLSLSPDGVFTPVP